MSKQTGILVAVVAISLTLLSLMADQVKSGGSERVQLKSSDEVVKRGSQDSYTIARQRTSLSRSPIGASNSGQVGGGERDRRKNRGSRPLESSIGLSSFFGKVRDGLRSLELEAARRALKDGLKQS